MLSLIGTQNTLKVRIDQRCAVFKLLRIQALNFSRLLTWTTYTSSLPLYQISNFFTSPLTFSVIPTAVICQETYAVYADTHTHTHCIGMSSTSYIRLTSCNTSVLSEHKHSHKHTPPLCNCFLLTASIINQEQQLLEKTPAATRPPHIQQKTSHRNTSGSRASWTTYTH